MSEERNMVLKMLKDGKITVEEAEALLEALEESSLDESSGGKKEEREREEKRKRVRAGIDFDFTGLGEELSELGEELMDKFGIRNPKGLKRIPQSYCKKCRTARCKKGDPKH